MKLECVYARPNSLTQSLVSYKKNSLVDTALLFNLTEIRLDDRHKGTHKNTH